MEILFQYYSIPFLVTSLIFMLLALPKTIIAIKRANIKSTPNLPPGPWRLPLIGNLHQLAGDLPHHRLRKLAKKHGPLMRLQLGELPYIVVSSPEIAKEMMITHDVNFAQRPYLLIANMYYGIDIAFAPYGEYWRMMRKICSEQLLGRKQILSFRAIREEETSNLIADLGLRKSQPINLSKKIVSMSYVITARAAFGKQCKEQAAFISSVDKVQKIAAWFGLADVFPSQKWLLWLDGLGEKIEKNARIVDKILDNIIDSHQVEDHNKCLLDVLLDLQNNNGDLPFPLDKMKIKAVLMDIFSAGSESSSALLEWAMLELLRNPRVMEKAQAEVRKFFEEQGNVDETGLHKLEYLNMIIKETLRLHPPSPLIIPRESKESCVINGFFVPAKTRVLVNVHAIGRDPRYWNEPDEFYPERFVDNSVEFKGNHFEFIPFGGGRRICPGISFATANVELTLAQLLFHFDWKLPNCENHVDMTEVFGTTVRRKGDIFLIPVPYDHSCYRN